MSIVFSLDRAISTRTTAQQFNGTNVNYCDVVVTVNGVELFFNIPVHRLPTVFTYHVITVSAHYHIVPDATQTVQQVECSADFLSQLRLFLNRGWNLVDICIDYTAIADGTWPIIV